MRTRFALAAALLLAVGVAVASWGSDAATARPFFLGYPAVIKASGTITYRWTYDSREKCSPGYSKTVEEELTFSIERKADLAIMIGKLAAAPLKGGRASLDVRLGGWDTTNFCDPQYRVPEPPEPICKSTTSPMVGVLTSTVADVPGDEEELAPLGRETQFTLARTKPFVQNESCWSQRPTIQTRFAHELGWNVDPAGGVAVGLGAPTVAYAHLAKGHTLRRQVKIQGGCREASAHASADRVRDPITNCTVNGVIFFKVTRTG
ncbi:MAG: hypothetical protein JST08_04470 [Actinobacteria bacterium]|nr:hypothetical protein [Actinomycetota bacterium]